MYSRRSLKKTAVPTLRLPTPVECVNYTEIEPLVQIKSESSVDIIIEPIEYQHQEYKNFAYSQNEQHTDTKDGCSQTSASSVPDQRKRKQEVKFAKRLKKVKNSDEKCDSLAEEQFLKDCDKLLSPKLNEMVRLQLYLKEHYKNNTYGAKFKIFCLNMYCNSPLAYRFLSKMICLPSKASLYKTYFPIETKISQQIWEILTATIKHMSPLQKECVICMSVINLKVNLSYKMKEDKILGLHEIDEQQRPVAAEFAVTLMLRGIMSSWKIPIGFSFISSNKSDDQLETWIIKTVKHLIHIGYKIRAFVTDLGSDFWNYSNTFDIKENSCLNIDSNKIYYIFDTPHLMKCVRNNFISNNFEFDGKTARWEDVKNMYEHDKTKEFRIAPRLTDSHVQPKSFQKQNIRLAVQALSNTVVVALRKYESEGAIEVANGTIDFIDTMNNLYDLLNSNDVKSSKSFGKPYTGNVEQETLLDKAQHMLSVIKIINKSNGNDVTDSVKFIDAFKVTINSLRKLYKDMKAAGYEYILTERINNDGLENFFGLVRQASKNCLEPTCFQYVRAFQTHFVCQILSLSDSTNFTEDSENILAHFEEFIKHQSEVPVPKDITIEDHKVPEENALYLCRYLLRRCVETHRSSCQSIVNYMSSYAHAISPGCSEVQVVPEDFVEYIHSLEKQIQSNFIDSIGDNIVTKLLQDLSAIDFITKPCDCFPKEFLVKLFIIIRISYIIRFNNRHLKAGKSKDQKYLSVPDLQ